MSIFGDIADAVGSAASWVEGAVSDVSHSPIGQMGLNVAGTMFGDPQLGSQVATATSVIDKIFGRGSTTAVKLSQSVRPTSLANGRILGSFSPHATLQQRAPASRTFAFRGKSGRVYRLTRAQLNALSQLAKTRAGGLLQTPMQIVSPPKPPPPPAQVPAAPATFTGAVLANSDAVAAAVAAGQPIKIGGQTLDTTKPIVLPPVMASVAQDIAASTGLDVQTPPPRDTSPRGFSNFTDDL